ncbi:hypothetical protein L4D17_24130 [Vibrio splendidus]|uniref:hypothetical protein n=1 Tax=Vibrio splendidus TaxID=29497 RepID=UPI00148CECF0|nr:hypothetical protein [Vibrio splendidus]NOJ06283.1 hypothetical protein [Vibrio splendidus]
MNLKKIVFSIAVFSAVVVGYTFFSSFPSPECRQYSGELRMGEEITTFTFSLLSKTVELETTFNQPLQKLGIPSEIHYQFQILTVTQQNKTWRYRLKELNSGFLQELEIKSDDDRYSIRWVNDRANNIIYKCTEVDNAKL